MRHFAVYGGPQLPRHKRKGHGKTKEATAKAKNQGKIKRVTAKAKGSRLSEKGHGKAKGLGQKGSQQKQKSDGKTRLEEHFAEIGYNYKQTTILFDFRQVSKYQAYK